MEDISTRDEEKAREQALEKGKEEERKRQEELERAKEDARKQAIQQERTRQKEKGSSMKYLVYVIILAIVLVAVAWFSLNVTVTNVVPGNALPFTTNYGVSFPEGQTITVGNTHINVLSYQNELISDIDGDRQNWLWAKTGLLPNGGQSSPPWAQ